ncbi:hypothetical protein [Marinimicrobium agarilyticum]|uniref:hypothetical protein n=1 Tax=Marinimicrobium agarilyticum TaxID=306546 RepID=UPI0004024D0C|nr:hypothetical protein [Marinimicrobium agarilyticum]
MGDEQRGSLHSQGVDVVIHVGAPKTGSSAIQLFSMNNRKALLDVGFYYPKHFVDKNGVSGGHSILSTLMLKKSFFLARVYFRCQLLKARLMKKTLLLSSEGFCRCASRFWPLLEGLNVRVVGWFRHPVEAFVSNYNQSIKRHFCTKTIGEVFENLPSSPRPPNLSGKRLRRWADLVGDDNCTFLPYLKPSQGEPEKPIEERWLEAIGVKTQYFDRFRFDAKRVNRSYVPDALELKRLLNVILSEDEGIDSHAVDWALQDYSDQSEHVEKGLSVYLEPEQVERLSRAFHRTNSVLANRFPAMKLLLDRDETYLHQSRGAQKKPLDLGSALRHLEQLCPNEIERIRAGVKHRLKTQKMVSSDVEKLALLLGLKEEC